jgi:hypothetical protein
MALTFIEPGTAATNGFEFYSSTIGTLSSVSTSGLNIDGPRCMSSAFTAPGRSLKTGVLADAGRRISAVMRKTGNPATSTRFIIAADGSGLIVLAVRLNTDGKLTIWGDGAGKDGTTVLSNDTTYTIGISYVVTSTTNWSAKLYINGVLEVSATNADFTLTRTGSTRLDIGPDVTSSGGTLYTCHVVVDDTTDLTSIGNCLVTAKLPASANTNSFEFSVGTGAVDERALSETNGKLHPNESDVQQNYTLQTAAVGDLDLTGATVLGRTAWVWAKRGTSGDAWQSTNGASAQNKTAGTTLVLTLDTTPALELGDTTLIAFAMDGATGTISATDNASTPNTYVVDHDVDGSGTGEVRTAIIRGRLTNTTSLTTITITHPSVTARAGHADQFRGINAATPLDKVAGTADAGASTTPSSGATATTAQNNEIIFGAIGWEGPDDSESYTAGTGMTPDQTKILELGTTGGGAASNITAANEYALQTATAAQTAGGTITNSRDWTALVATYKSGGTGVGNPDIMDNGTETAITLAATSALYTVLTTSASYPSNAAGIGIRSNGTTSSSATFLYECGTLVAYIPVVAFNPGTDGFAWPTQQAGETRQKAMVGF